MATTWAGLAELEVDELSDALAALHVAELREHNRLLELERASVDSELVALRARLAHRAAQWQGLVQMQEQLAIARGPPPLGEHPNLIGLKRIPLDRFCGEASLEGHAKLKLSFDVGSEEARENDVEMEPEPGGSVHDELRGALRSRTRLEHVLARKAEQRRALSNLIAHNDELIARLGALNDRLLAELREARSNALHNCLAATQGLNVERIATWPSA